MLEGVCALHRTKIGISIQGSSIHLDERTLMLSESVVKKWKIPTNQNLILQHGSLKQEVKIVPISRTNILRMNLALAARFGLQQGATLCLQYKASRQTLRLGPLIGVMVSRVYASSSEKPFGVMTAFCKEMTDACRMFGAQVFFVTPDEMHADPQSINGHVYSHDQWSKKSFPVPNVIYNRLTSRKYENLANVQQFMKDVKARGTQIFNEKYLDKTEVFDALGKDQSIHIYLPESYLFKNYEMLKSMSSRHSTLFLKPITGSLGKGIIRVEKHPGESYNCQFTNAGGARKKEFDSLPAVFTALSGKLKSQRYQLQQGLELITAEGRPVDFRALVQKGARGVWTITSVVARIASTQQFVSNIARGGSLGTVKDTLGKSSLNAQQRVSVYDRLRKASLEIATSIEAQIPNHFGELGIDLAVDAQGKIWLLEVNSKPSKDDNTPLSEQRIRPSVKQIVQYARFLANY
jgi:glutathione synthase/RimK-type ligase-like ATP-grasp enzyme